MKAISELAGARELFVNLTLRELRGKYKRSLLGWAWSLLNPLATMAVFAVVFRLFLRVEPPVGDPSRLHVYALFLLCGLLPWTYLGNAVTGGMGVLISNANLVKKVWFPREVLVGANVTSWLVSFAIEMVVLVAVLIGFGNMALPWVPLVALVMVLQTVYVLGVALLLSVANVYFRDVQHLVAIGLQIWFYATPVIYPIGLVEDFADRHQGFPVMGVYELNPMVHFVEVYRDLFYDLHGPDLRSVAYLLATSVLSVVVGWAAFRRLEPRLAEEL